MDDSQNWYLMKHDDGTIFGPVVLEQLQEWAAEAQISPLDKISNDQKNWIKAPMVAELQMDYLVEVSADQFYGPTTLGAIREFFLAGEITAQNQITNCKDGSQSSIEEMFEIAVEEPPPVPVRTSIRTSLQQRIRDLEEALVDERRAREVAERRCEKLETLLGDSE